MKLHRIDTPGTISSCTSFKGGTFLLYVEDGKSPGVSCCWIPVADNPGMGIEGKISFE
ncbi:MAG: hypothetical protein U5K69_00175 [Balneolaceae bacterium]|nr:hypothetical protein [Balneolaceae bacterium]